MSRHPLLERAQAPEVKQARGFREVAAALTGGQLAAEYAREKEGAPRRGDAGKKFLVSHNTRLAEARRRGRDAEHLAIALVQHARKTGPLELPEGGSFEPIHAGVALKSAQPDKALGADDPNWGVDKLDVVGIGPEDRLAVAVVRYVDPEGRRVGTGDTPLRVLLEGLAQTAIVEANRDALTRELSARTERSLSDAPPVLLVVGSLRYWELCRRREAQKGAAWIRELERLAGELEESCGVSVQYLGIRLSGDPGWSYASGAPLLDGAPRLLPAWEPGAGRVRPKPRPRRRKEAAAPAETVIEADLSRPIRPYAVHEHYAPGDRIQHPTLGVGVVQGPAGPQKIRVLFDERKSLLVHDRPVSGAEHRPH